MTGGFLDSVAAPQLIIYTDDDDDMAMSMSVRQLQHSLVAAFFYHDKLEDVIHKKAVNVKLTSCLHVALMLSDRKHKLLFLVTVRSKFALG